VAEHITSNNRSVQAATLDQRPPAPIRAWVVPPQNQPTKHHGLHTQSLYGNWAIKALVS
jgi:hypothetical protein